MDKLKMAITSILMLESYCYQKNEYMAELHGVKIKVGDCGTSSPMIPWTF